MAITIDLPHVGESVVEGIIGKWLKLPGDRVEKYDPLVEVVTDKVTMEVPSPVGGVLSRVLVQEGDTVPMGAPIAEIEGDEPPAAPSTQSADARGVAAETATTTGYLVKDLAPVGPTGGGVGEAPPLRTESASEARRVEGAPGKQARQSPAVRRLARDHGVDLARVPGTGSGGRITRSDVLTYAESAAAEAPSAAPASSTQAIPGAGPPGDTTISLSPIRRLIAQHMVKSTSEIPHAWSMVEVDVTVLVGHRQSVREEFQRREGIDLTYLPFAIKAVVESLKEHPMLNSAWVGDGIVLKSRVNIGVAVAAPDGLLVPVIHDADSLSIAGLAKAARELALKARDGKLALDDVQGGTFTLNNTGALGSIISQPIINHPQAGILTTEAIQKRAVVVNDAIAIRSMMNVCLSFDHRVVDGAQGAAFLQAVKARLESMGPDTAIY